MTLPIRRLRYPSARPLLDNELAYMEYFQVVCAGEFSLFFELPAWESIILQGTLAEPAMHHAALAIGALTSSRYHPGMWQITPSAIAFSIRHYSMAIQHLHRRLDDGSSSSLELAVITSIVFSYVEFLLDSRFEMHIRAGRAILEDLYVRHDRTVVVSAQAGSNCQIDSLSTKYDLLASAMFQLTAQVDCSVASRSNSND